MHTALGTVLASSEMMANPSTTGAGGGRFTSTGSIVLAAGLTALFTIIATLLSGLFRAAPIMLLLTTLAFMAAGYLTVRIRATSHPVEPASGAALATLIFGALQVALTPGVRAELGVGQIVTSLLIAVAFAFSFAWAGAVLGKRSGAPPFSRGSRWARRRGAPESGRDRAVPSSPSSRPAHGGSAH